MTGCGTPPGHRAAAPNALSKLDVTKTALQLAADRSRWESLVRFDAISRCRISLDVDGKYEAWLLTWLPGQHTVWHDHGGSEGAFVVLQGILTEQRAAVRLDSPPSAEPSPSSSHTSPCAHSIGDTFTCSETPRRDRPSACNSTCRRQLRSASTASAATDWLTPEPPRQETTGWPTPRRAPYRCDGALAPRSARAHDHERSGVVNDGDGKAAKHTSLLRIHGDVASRLDLLVWSSPNSVMEERNIAR